MEYDDVCTGDEVRWGLNGIIPRLISSALYPSNSPGQEVELSLREAGRAMSKLRCPRGRAGR